MVVAAPNENVVEEVTFQNVLRQNGEDGSGHVVETVSYR